VFGVSGWFVLNGANESVATLADLIAITTDYLGNVRLVRATGTQYRWNGIIRQLVGQDNQALTNNLGNRNATTNTPTITSGVGNP
jgi:ABC-type Na+ efflux pump permease subunit